MSSVPVHAAGRVPTVPLPVLDLESVPQPRMDLLLQEVPGTTWGAGDTGMVYGDFLEDEARSSHLLACPPRSGDVCGPGTSFSAFGFLSFLIITFNFSANLIANINSNSNANNNNNNNNNNDNNNNNINMNMNTGRRLR